MKPPDDANAFVKEKELFPDGSTWLHLTHKEKIICGPFEFTTINRCKTLDIIPKAAWFSLITSAKYHIKNIFYLRLSCVSLQTIFSLNI